jgi:hypothetical protein
MAKFRYTGRGATVSVESTSDSWKAVGLTRNIAPPALEKSAIDCTAMEDTFVVVEQGIEQESGFTFTCLQASTDPADVLLQTYYGSGAERPWRIGRTNGALTWYTNFNGVVSALRPQAFTGSDPATMEVQVLRTSAITESTPA